MPDVLVTGLPRSGLTLAAALIDSLPNCVCLNSPQVQSAQARKLHETIPFTKWLAGDFVWQRSRLSTQDAVNDYRLPDGTTYTDGLKDPAIFRDENGDPKLVSLIKPGLTGDFVLAMKHDTLYSCILPSVIQMSHFKIIVIIRHPFDVIQSWRTLPDEQIGQGMIPFAKHYWPEASLIDPEQKINLTDRMVQIYELFMQRYHELKPYIQILKYEDMLSDPALLSRLLGIDMVPPAASRIVRQQRIREASALEALKERFRKLTVYTRYFYPDMQ